MLSAKLRIVFIPKGRSGTTLKKLLSKDACTCPLMKGMLRHLIISHPRFLKIVHKKEYRHIQKKEKDWFRLKGYVHIGPQQTPADRKRIEPYVKDKISVAKHSFMPFIHKELKVRKFRKEMYHDGTRSKLRKLHQKHDIFIIRTIWMLKYLVIILSSYQKDMKSYW